MNNETLKEHLRQYLEFSTIIKEATDARKEISKEIQGFLIAKKAKRIQTPKGTFSLKEFRKWEYSDDIKEMEEEIGFAKTEEQENGKAQATIIYNVAFRPKTEKEKSSEPTLISDI